MSKKQEGRKRRPGDLFVTKRGGKIAYWVMMPHGDAFNLWDLSPDEATPQVDKAIGSAFRRGMEFMHRVAYSEYVRAPHSIDFDYSAAKQED